MICQQSFCSCCANSIGSFVCFTPIYSKYVALAIGYDGRRIYVLAACTLKIIWIIWSVNLSKVPKLKHRCFIFTTSAKAYKEKLGWGIKGGIVDHSRHTLENRSLDYSKKKSLPR